MKEIVQEAGDMAVTGETTDTADTIRGIRDLSPEIVVTGPLTDCADSIAAVRKIAAEVSPRPPRFLALVDAWDARYLDTPEPEVGGLLYTNASAEELRAAIRMLSAGYSFLAPEAHPRRPRPPAPSGLRPPPVSDMTGRELEVLRLLARGYTNAETSR
ncbi:DNA-binding response regulator [Sphaerisporangium album]|uniref:DNA-binding response regulator n=1 Tax=Sphaerisporangium album TaxID=509200 RepID=A0A367FUD3_9ACTN|nr:DNA-binding response regulator [Sphaerisporangium album]